MSLNKRRRELVRLLSEKKVDLYSLSKELNISTRTVRRELDVIATLVKVYKCELVKEDNVYFIVGTKENLANIILKNPNIEYTLIENQIILLEKVLNSQVNFKNFSEYSYISSEEKRILLDSLLVICDYKNDILYLKNDEVKIRQTISLLLMNLVMESNYWKIYEDLNLEEVFVKKVFLVITKLIDVELFNLVALKVVNVYKTYQLYIGEQELVHLTIVLLVNKRRQDLGYMVDMERKTFSGLTNSVASIIKFDMKNYQCVIEQISKFTLEVENYSPNSILLEKVNQFFKLIERTLRLTKCDLFELHANLTAHILRNYGITKTKLKLEDHPFAELISGYQFIYFVIKEAAFKENLKFSDVEIAEIMIYYILYLEEIITDKNWKILVICMGGMGTSLMIKNQIQQLFHKVTINNIPLSSLSSMSIDDYDIVVSNLEIKNIEGIIVVRPLLTSEDIHSIKQQLIYKEIGMREVRQGNRSLVEKSIIYKKLQLQGSKNNILQIALSNLEESNLIDDKNYIYEKLVRREKHGIGVANSKIAMYHTTSQSILEPVIMIISTNDFITLGFDQQKMICNTILLILIPTLNSSEVMNKISYLSQLIIFDPKICKMIEQGKIEQIQNIIDGGKSFIQIK